MTYFELNGIKHSLNIIMNVIFVTVVLRYFSFARFSKDLIFVFV
jgi:hypothetical protein